MASGSGDFVVGLITAGDGVWEVVEDEVELVTSLPPLPMSNFDVVVLSELDA